MTAVLNAAQVGSSGALFMSAELWLKYINRIIVITISEQGNLEGWSMVNTKQSFYSPHNIQFLGVQARALNGPS